MIGQTISHYKILERLGEGGMGVVYKAHDQNLDRLVAIKVLSVRGESSSQDFLRFEQEAKAISALNHPHIATIHDRGVVDGKPFLVLEYLAGGTLREKLLRCHGEGGQLPVKDLLRYAIEAARALAHAHRRGVIHRDVKTDNLILTEDGIVKVTDFGVAKWNTGARITGQGHLLGTAAYMSPEQAQGLNVDARSDVFSLGVVLFELSTGRLPFDGLYPAAIAYDIIHTPVRPPRAQRPDLPEALENMIYKAMAKSPADRYERMESFLTDLEALQSALLTGTGSGPTIASPVRRRRMIAAAAVVFLALAAGVAGWRIVNGGGAPPPTPAHRSGPLSIAVLPMENLSNDSNQDYLADGMTEALITDLAKSGDFRVISRTSVMQYKRSGKSLRDIARELNVDRIVEGSVIKAGDEIRITAQLIDTATDEHLWAESYQRNLTDVLSLQEDVAQTIANEVRTKLGGNKGRTRVARPVNPQAYEAYLRARQLAFQWSPESIERGIGYYKKAIEIDATYANAHAGLAAAYGLKALFGMAPPSSTWPLARAAAERALELDDEAESAHTSLGFVQASYDWNWYGAEREFLRAIELNPGSATAHHAYAMVCLAPQGRLDEALAEIEQARNLDPLSAAVNLNVGDMYYFRHEFEKATQQYRKTLELDANFPNVRRWLGNAACSMGNRTAAAEYYRQAVGAQGDRNPVALVAYLITTGREEEAREKLKRLGQDPVASRLLAADLAALYTMLGDKEAAFEWLERAYLERSGSLTFTKVSPSFEPLHSDPRFQSLLRRLNLER